MLVYFATILLSVETIPSLSMLVTSIPDEAQDEYILPPHETLSFSTTSQLRMLVVLHEVIPAKLFSRRVVISTVINFCFYVVSYSCLFTK